MVPAALAIMVMAGCGAAQPRPATVTTCFAFGVRAIQERLTVTRIPRACAGLSAVQVNVALDRAVRAAVGPLAKAPERRAAVRDSRYLEHLFRTLPPPRAEPVPVASPQRSATGPLEFAALGAWLAAAAAGSYLLASWVGLARRRRTRPPAIPIAHASLAIAGLGIWTAFLAAGTAVLAWLAVGLILIIAGLGMATLVTGLPDPRAAASARPQRQVLVVVLHGMLATVAILFVLLAAVSAG